MPTMVVATIGEVAAGLLSGVIIAVLLTFYVNYLVDRRLAVLLRRATRRAIEDDDWPAPPRYDPDDTPPM